MRKFKKLLSIILSISFLLISTLSLSALADDYADYCYKNSKGGYANPECAFDELLKVSHNEADYVNVGNLGQAGDQVHCAFNFRAFDEMFEKNKLISLNNLNKRYETLRKKCNDLSDIWTKENIFYIISGALIGAVTGLFCFENSKNQDSIGHNSINQGTSPQAPIFHSNGRAFSSLIRGIIGTVTGAMSTIMGLKIKSEIDKQNLDEQMSVVGRQLSKIDHENECKANLFNCLLPYLERPEYINFDMVTYEVHAEDCNFHWGTRYAGINYTKEEKKSFPQKFKETAAKIRKNLAENGKLDPHNFFKPQDNALTE